MLRSIPIPENPYSPPLQSTPEQSRLASQARLGRYFLWSVVLLANMIVPMMFGLSILRDTGRTGLAVAACAFLIGGCLVCYVSNAWGRRLVFGTLLLAFTQFLPILQIMAGLFAIEIVGKLNMNFDAGLQDMPQATSELAGFLLTVFTGLPLATIAVVLGSLFCFFFPEKSSRKHRANPITSKG